MADKELVKRINAFAQKPGARPNAETLRHSRSSPPHWRTCCAGPTFTTRWCLLASSSITRACNSRSGLRSSPLSNGGFSTAGCSEASFPDAVRKSPFNLEKATVPVRVVATKEPVTLILCSYESVRWVIQAGQRCQNREGDSRRLPFASSHGTKAPVAFHVYEQPVKKGEPRTYFNAYKRGPQMSSTQSSPMSSKKLTGKEITTFQATRYLP